MKRAREIIASVKDKGISIEELCHEAVRLSERLLARALEMQTWSEKSMQAQLARMMEDPSGKAFTVALTDQCFRSSNATRIMARYRSLLKHFGIPKFLSFDKRIGLRILKVASKGFPAIATHLLQSVMQHATALVLVPGEVESLAKHIMKRQKEGVRINLNRLGEAILGEMEASKRLQTYIEDLQKPEVEYISVKISTLYSQINLLAREKTLAILEERLKSLYRAAQAELYLLPDGSKKSKFVNLDMEEYRDLHLTVEVFCRVLSEPEFLHLSAGIVLQSYLPDSFAMQQKLTDWALDRCSKGGAPIKIRIVKGANLAMEQVDASLHGWPQAPYTSKCEVDANYKKMLLYGSDINRATAVHIGVASHNLFDISFALLLRAKNNLKGLFSFEMLEGMADHIRRAVQEVSGDMLLYCPAVTKAEFQNGMAYLIRRLDENSAPENFLHCLFGLTSHSRAWLEQQEQFLASITAAATLSSAPRRTQNRQLLPPTPAAVPFENEPDTDWSLPHNVEWGQEILREWQQRTIEIIPLVSGVHKITPSMATGIDPSFPAEARYRYCLGSADDIDEALTVAQTAFASWRKTAAATRAELLAAVAEQLRKQRGDLIGSMVLDAGKSLFEADVEVSEAIDFAEYYRRNIEEWTALTDIEWQPKGIILVAPPWNFPCSIPAGGILAALATGNVVLFKPAPEAVLVGWTLVQLLWKAGIDKNVLQFINCVDEPVGGELVKDPRLAAIILTGATATAKAFLKMRPGLDLLAETGGKNSIIVTSLADRDLAIKDIIRSAFGHSGQKCSACSLAILEAEVYDSPHFQQQLRDAASSFHVGIAWDPASVVTPLIKAPIDPLLRGLTVLEPGETWLLEPIQDKHNPQLWSPGIKLGVQEGSFTHQTELFGPILGVMRATSLEHAISLANGTPYGLTGGLHSLDISEKEIWSKSIEVGNGYINRTITGAIVQRQPFGGCKESSFGRGLKAGGPNYLTQLMFPVQKGAPKEKTEISPALMALTIAMRGADFSSEERALWRESAESYAYHWEAYFQKAHDPSSILGQQNLLIYRPIDTLHFRMHASEKLIDLFRILAAAVTTGCPLEISGKGETYLQFDHLCSEEEKYATKLTLVEESEEEFQLRIKDQQIKRIRMSAPPSMSLLAAFAENPTCLIVQPVVSNGRVELLNYLREISLSSDFHRYGNLYQLAEL